MSSFIESVSNLSIPIVNYFYYRAQDEYFAVLNRFDLDEEDIEDLTILFSNPGRTVLVKPDRRINLVEKDPDDNKFLECASTGGADFIISGDRHLLEIKKLGAISILTANEFLEYFNE